MAQIIVPPEGRRDAKLVLVGEAPGTREMSQRRPFVGPSFTQRLRPWWESVGLNRRDFYIDNVVPYQPESIDRVPADEMREHIRALKHRIAALDGPVVIVPTGNYALWALTGKGRVAWDWRDGKHKKPGITSHRGSIYSYELRPGVRVKVIPTIHPAATFVRGGKRAVAAQYIRACLADWRRIAADRHFLELRIPEREHYIRPTLDDVAAFADEVAALPPEAPLAVDIETPPTDVRMVQTVEKRWVPAGTVPDDRVALYKGGAKRGQPRTRTDKGYAVIDCIGFAYDERWSITIPLTRAYWRTAEAHAQAWRYVAVMLAAPCAKVMQNGMYDSYWLRTERAADGTPRVPRITNWVWDTRAMHHALDPTDRHSLEYLVSVFTRTPYYKDEAKDPESIARYGHGDALWTYNGKDCTETLAVWHALRAAHDRAGIAPFYWSHYARMIEPMLEMALHGIRLDEHARRARLTALAVETQTAAERLLEASGGVPLIAPKGVAVSPERLKSYLYGDLAIPPLTKRRAKGAGGGKSVTVDEVALKKIARKFPQAAPVCAAVLEHRAARKAAEPLAEGKADPDCRVRAVYSFYTNHGRLASQSNPRGTGCNLQNMPRPSESPGGKTRAIFLPDEEPAS